MAQRISAALPPLRFGLQGMRFLRHLPNFARLYWRLLRDRRVSFWPKLMLVGSFAYMLSPLDLLPDLLPVLGLADDVVLLLAVCRAFIYLCPRDVVREHVAAIANDRLQPTAPEQSRRPGL